MQYDDDIRFEIGDDRVATLTLDRAAKHNALTLAMLDAIDRALAQVEANGAARVLLIRSASPRFFSAGADIREWGEIDAERMGSRFIRAGNRVFRRLAELDIPTVAVLNGSALGGGFELALACDLRYGAASIRVGFPEASVGAIPGWLGGTRLAELAGPGRAREMVLLGDAIDAARAAQWGILNEVLPDAALEARVQAVCATLRARSRVSQSVAKRLLRAGDAGALHELAASTCKATPDALEGVAAFRGKRAAQFA
ncbi:enoyl-CoA hydratase/isomerase family protein [Burkholderia perseverans]|uniref:enoyl-CoA hydratase/isomerase family protein n=1 Tax=Burkholderia perseverans TaxID=2615214 RepID=UPI001FED3C8F|nr:enoyl-CoA hydratase/isomerase family protein [Burkholderia perseverans]